MKSQSHLFPIILMARLLRLSVSRFYDWLKRGMSKRSIQRNQQTILVKIAHEETKQSYSQTTLLFIQDSKKTRNNSSTESINHSLRLRLTHAHLARVIYRI
jgi:hypothetical protein